ncbi:acetyltransferase [Winogradskyella sp.]|uniref:acetyltransferase n=1 Tax=Winogradskyella sp. TaxID=1883156 RepID=UPI0025D411B8|nr:acetyltransferase [Winogradskyella sp.]
MKATYIVGACGAAKEIYYLIKRINQAKPTFNFKGFLDLNPEHHELKIGSETFSVFDESQFIQNQKEDCNIIFGIAFPDRLKPIIEKYTPHSIFHFPNVIHPNIQLDESVTLGKGNIIAEAAIFTVDITLGDFNFINRGIHIGHDVTIGNANVINPCTVVSGGINIKNNNLIGTNATIIQYLNIDSGNTIGAGAVVTKSISNNTTVIGVPAKPVKND